MQKLTTGQINCLLNAKLKNGILENDRSFAGKSMQQNCRYIPKLVDMGLLKSAFPFLVYTLTDKGLEVINEYEFPHK